MGASSSVLLNQVAEDKREEVTKRFSELLEAGKTEDEACAIVLKEFQTNLPQPPVEDEQPGSDGNIELAGNSVYVPNEPEKVNKSKLTLIKKKARRSNPGQITSFERNVKTAQQTPGPKRNADDTTASQTDSPGDNVIDKRYDVNTTLPSKDELRDPQSTLEAPSSQLPAPSSFTNASPPPQPTAPEELTEIVSSGAGTPALCAVEKAGTEASDQQTAEGTAAATTTDASPAVAPSATTVVVSKDELMRRYGEVEFLLRSPLTSDAEIAQAVLAARQGLTFIEELTRHSQEMEENRGMLLRWILPFDATTSISDQSNVQAAGTYSGSGTGSAVSAEQQARFSAAIAEAEKSTLLEGALALRKLVRVKLSDEADLKQGLASVTDTNSFLQDLQNRAAADNVTAYELLKTL